MRNKSSSSSITSNSKRKAAIPSVPIADNNRGSIPSSSSSSIMPKPITKAAISPRQPPLTLQDLPDEEKQKMARIVERLMAVVAENEDLRAANDKIKQELDLLQNIREENDSKMSALEEENMVQSAGRATATGLLHLYQTKLVALVETLRKTQSDADKFKEKCTSLEEEVKRMDELVESQRVKLNDKDNDSSHDITKLENEVIDLRFQLQNNEDALNQANAKAEAAALEQQRLQTTVDVLESDLSKRKANNIDLKVHDLGLKEVASDLAMSSDSIDSTSALRRSAESAIKIGNINVALLNPDGENDNSIDSKSNNNNNNNNNNSSSSNKTEDDKNNMPGSPSSLNISKGGLTPPKKSETGIGVTTATSPIPPHVLEGLNSLRLSLQSQQSVESSSTRSSKSNNRSRNSSNINNSVNMSISADNLSLHRAIKKAAQSAIAADIAIGESNLSGISKRSYATGVSLTSNTNYQDEKSNRSESASQSVPMWKRNLYPPPKYSFARSKIGNVHTKSNGEAISDSEVHGNGNSTLLAPTASAAARMAATAAIHSDPRLDDSSTTNDTNALITTNYLKKKSSQDGGSNNKSKNGKAMWAFDRHMPWDPRSSVTTKNSNGDIRSSIDDLEVRKVLKNANRVPKKIDRLKEAEALGVVSFEKVRARTKLRAKEIQAYHDRMHSDEEELEKERVRVGKKTRMKAVNVTAKPKKSSRSNKVNSRNSSGSKTNNNAGITNSTSISRRSRNVTTVHSKSMTMRNSSESLLSAPPAKPSTAFRNDDNDTHNTSNSKNSNIDTISTSKNIKERASTNGPVEYEWNQVTSSHIKSPSRLENSTSAKPSSSIEFSGSSDNHHDQRSNKIKDYTDEGYASVSVSGSFSGRFLSATSRTRKTSRVGASHDKLYDLSLFDLVDELNIE